jgi:hypothetical protein
LTTIDSEAVKRQVTRGTNFIWAVVSLLPVRERFQTLCYGLRSITDQQRKVLFGAMPPLRKVYELCIASGEMGKRFDEWPPESLPPDDPALILPLMNWIKDETSE